MTLGVRTLIPSDMLIPTHVVCMYILRLRSGAFVSFGILLVNVQVIIQCEMERTKKNKKGKTYHQLTVSIFLTWETAGGSLPREDMPLNDLLAAATRDGSGKISSGFSQSPPAFSLGGST